MTTVGGTNATTTVHARALCTNEGVLVLHVLVTNHRPHHPMGSGNGPVGVITSASVLLHQLLESSHCHVGERRCFGDIVLTMRQWGGGG